MWLGWTTDAEAIAFLREEAMICDFYLADDSKLLAVLHCTCWLLSWSTQNTLTEHADLHFLFPLQCLTMFNLVCRSGFRLHSQSSIVCLVLQCMSMTLFARALKSSCVCAWGMSQLVGDIWVSVLLVFASATLGDSPSGSTPTVCCSGPIVVCCLARVHAASVICPSVRVAARGRTPCFAELAL